MRESQRKMVRGQFMSLLTVGVTLGVKGRVM